MSPSEFSEPYQSFVRVASRLSLKAGRRIMELLEDLPEKQIKADRSPVTVADFAADQILRDGLSAAFPDHRVLTEESGLAGPEGSRYIWVVDPLDGTRAYARGEHGFSVMVGLLENGVPVLGVVFDPVEQCLYQAVKGQGCDAIQNGERRKIRVTDRSEWDTMRLVVSTGFPEALLESVVGEMGFEVLPPINSVGIKVALLATQKGELYLNHHGVHYWDTCAPLVLMQEAGGEFTSYDGSALDFSMNGVYNHAHPTFASNGPRHADFVEYLKSKVELRDGRLHLKTH
ncbi:MAG: 3'(2'),5'-bisphosphate nucleotidase CysQ [Candidatus Omnitrophica bacterium]|nr:3'(2'),5'-bisphosphate nucleotidase CysQ [Candidatus Omnitrophota bacterium]